MTLPAAPSQKQLVDRFISWPLVQERLSRFPSLASAFPLEDLQRHRNAGPYFCHYMAWRLGTWRDDGLLSQIDELLQHAERLPNWESERLRLHGRDFAEFWSLVWQLQVARYLGEVGRKVQWRRDGPDLEVHIGSEPLYVECYVYRKSFGVELFIEEILSHLGEDLRVTHHPYLPLSLREAERESQLSQLLAPLLDETLLDRARRDSEAHYPIVLSSWPGASLSIHVDGPSVSSYDPALAKQAVGDPAWYLEVALKETASAKTKSNALDKFHPNLLAICYSLSAEAQGALARAERLAHPLPHIALDEHIDALAFSTVGIDEALSKSRFRLVQSKSAENPATQITLQA